MKLDIEVFGFTVFRIRRDDLDAKIKRLRSKVRALETRASFFETQAFDRGEALEAAERRNAELTGYKSAIRSALMTVPDSEEVVDHEDGSSYTRPLNDTERIWMLVSKLAEYEEERAARAKKESADPSV